MAKSKKVTLRVSKKTSLNKEQFRAVRGVLADLGLELNRPEAGGPEVSGVTCGEHSCEGFQPGGPSDDCVSLHSKCSTEACDGQECHRHTCGTEACSEQSDCQSHHCTSSYSTTTEIVAMMAKESKSFGLLLQAQRQIDTKGISLSFDA